MAARVIFHIDINAFFASAEEILNPSLKGTPFAVAHNSRKSVITTANYAARSYGVRSAMPVHQAKEKCAGLVLVDPHFEFYHELSEKFMNYLRTYTDLVEPASIDEAYVDMTKPIQFYEKPLDLAVKIQQEVLQMFQLPISIGIAPNKFLAKIASDMKKPLGISVLRIREIQTKLWPMAIQEMGGIGKKTEQRLRTLGLSTIGDLAMAQKDDLEPILGINAETMIQRANGLDYREIATESSIQSISQSRTIANPTFDEGELKDLIGRLVDTASSRLNKEVKLAKGISLTLRSVGQRAQVQSMRFTSPTHSYDEIYQSSIVLFDQFDSGEVIDFCGIALYDLIEEYESKYQMDLFSVSKEESSLTLVNELNKVFNQDLLQTGSDYFKRKAHDDSK